MHISLDSALGRQRRLNSVGESITQIAPDPAAAYSLRSLTGGDPKVVRVRRGSDNHEQDFTASDVSSGALQDFVNAQVVAPLDIQALSATGRDGDFLIANAAYSLRSLGTRQATLAATGDTVARADGKFVCQVRRPSDDALKSFTAAEVTDGTLLSFVTEEVTLLDGTDFSTGFPSGIDEYNPDSALAISFGNSIGGSDNTYLAEVVGSGVFLPLRASLSTNIFVGDTVTFSVEVFLPTSNTSTGITLLTNKLSTSSHNIQVTRGSWQTISATSTVTSSGLNQFRIQQFIDASNNSVVAVGEKIYVRRFKVTVKSSDGFVKTWYDQSVTTQAGDTATGNHATQATAANQPKIVSAGTLLNELVFDGSNDFLQTAANFDAFGANSLGLFMVVNPSDLSGNPRFLNTRSGTPGIEFILTATPRLYYKDSGGTGTNGDNQSASLSAGTEVLYTNIVDRDTDQIVEAFKNGSSVTISSATNLSSVGSVNAAELTIGANNSGGNLYNGKTKEIIIYASNQEANRTAIEANIGEAYSIDLPSGVDPGFDQVDGFVETWYDQSGNGNDAVQATASLQPKIVNAGSLVTGGLLFDGSNNILSANDVSSVVTGEDKPLGVFTVASRQSATAIRALWAFERSTTTTPSIQVSTHPFIDKYGYKISDDSATVKQETDAAYTDDTQFLMTFASSGTLLDFGKNGTLSQDDEDVDVGTITLDRFTIGGGVHSNVLEHIGSINEIIVYASDQRNNRTAIETNINSHYSIF